LKKRCIDDGENDDENCKCDKCSEKLKSACVSPVVTESSKDSSVLNEPPVSDDDK
jgi:hypothetical protein